MNSNFFMSLNRSPRREEPNEKEFAYDRYKRKRFLEEPLELKLKSFIQLNNCRMNTYDI